MQKKDLKYFLNTYLHNRPLFLSLIRAKEAFLFQKYLPLKTPVLDVGCGDGFFAKVAFGKKLDVGLDVSQSRVEEARKSGEYKKIVIYGGEKMPFKSNSFGSVVSNCVLEHIPNLPMTVREAYRVLRPGGLFITSVMAKPWEENLFGTSFFGKSYREFMRKKQVHLNLNTRNSWDGVFVKAGFRIKECTGYLSPSACRLIDFCHYVSVPSLIFYKLTGKWAPIKELTGMYPGGYFEGIISGNADKDRAGALFYVLKK